MTDNAENSLTLRIFKVSGVHFGCDAEQIIEMTAYYGEASEDLHWFHEETFHSDATPLYNSPTIVSVDTGTAASYRVIIDSMEDIAEFDQQNIHLFPSFLEPYAVSKGFWGILPYEGKLLFLIDFNLMLKNRRK